MNTEPDDRWEQTWDARVVALSKHFGDPSDHVFHATIPFGLGGAADVLEFPSYKGGRAYVTSEMTGGDMGQVSATFDSYELLICTRSQSEVAARLISQLARYTCEARIFAGETMDVADAFEDQTIRALLFCHPEQSPVTFDLNGRTCGVILCIGITKEELALARAKGSDEVLQLLTRNGVFPFTEPNRASLVAKPWYRFW